MKRGKLGEKLVYYLAIVTAVVVAILVILQINVTFGWFDMPSAKFFIVVISLIAQIFVPLILLSSLLALKFNKTEYGKKSIGVLTWAGIAYATITIIIAIVNTYRIYNSPLYGF